MDDEDSEDEGAKWESGASSGPSTGPLKNRAYRPRFAASRLAVARSDGRPAAPRLGASLGTGFGVVLPDVEAGVPEMGRRLERMPVVVRRGGRDPGSETVREGSWARTWT